MNEQPSAASKIKSGTTTILVGATVVVCVCTLGAVLSVIIFHPDGKSNTSDITALVGISAPIVLSLLALLSREQHLAVNSRITQLLELTEKSSEEVGKNKEKERVQTLAHEITKPGVIAQVDKSLDTLKDKVEKLPKGDET